MTVWHCVHQLGQAARPRQSPEGIASNSARWSREEQVAQDRGDIFFLTGWEFKHHPLDPQPNNTQATCPYH